MRKPHKVLNISPNATKEEAKKAFKKLAKEYHPDRPTGNEKKFKEIKNAYDNFCEHPDETLGHNPNGHMHPNQGAYNPWEEAYTVDDIRKAMQNTFERENKRHRDKRTPTKKDK